MKEWLRDVFDDDWVWFLADYDFEKYEKILQMKVLTFERYFYRKLERLENGSYD